MTKFLLPHVLHNTKYFLYTSFNRIYKYIRSNNRTNLILLFLNYIYIYIFDFTEIETHLPEVDRIRQVTAPRPAFSVSTVMQYSSP